VKLKALLFIFLLLLSFLPLITFATQTSDSIYIFDKKNILISNLKIIGGNITIINSRNIVIKDNIISNSVYFGIFVYNSSNITIIHNVISKAYYDGISIRESRDITIEFNTIANNSNGNGISVWDFSSFINITENHIVNNQYGVFVLSSSNVSVVNNVISNTSFYGVYLYDSNSIKIFNNSILHSDVGVEIQYGGELTVFHNSIIVDLIGVYVGEGINSLNVIDNLVENSRYFGILVYIYPLVFNFTSNMFFNNTHNFFYAYNSTLPSETVETTVMQQITSTTTKTSINHNLPYILAVVVIIIFLSSLIVRRRKK